MSTAPPCLLRPPFGWAGRGGGGGGGGKGPTCQDMIFTHCVCAVCVALCSCEHADLCVHM